MAFELFTKQAARSTREPKITVSKVGTLHLNAACLAQYFEGVDYVQLLFDAKTHRVALKPAKAKDEHAYKICRTKQGGAQISASAYLKHYGIKHAATKAFDARWLDKPGAVVITVK